MKTNSIINAFTVGEISPRLAGRTDIQQYYQSCSELLNMVVEIYGGAKKNVGTYFVKEVKDSSKDTRIKRFVFSDTQAYIIEIGDEYMRFYKDNGQIVHTVSSTDAWVTSTSYVVGDFVNQSSTVYYCIVAHTSGTFSTDLAAGKWIAQTAYEIPTDYTEDEIWDLQFAQKEDILYITHPDHPQAELTRSGHTAWTLTEIDYTDDSAAPALQDMNVTDTTLTLADNTHPSVTLTASAALFDTTSPSLHIGSIWKINSAKSVSADDWAESTSYSVNDYVTFNDEIYWCVSAHTSGSSFSVDLDAGKWSLQDIYVQITAVTDSTHATGNILYSSRLEASPVATTTWYEGAWSDKRGYPKSVTLFENRLVYGYTPHQPQTTWESEIGAYNTFELGTNDSDATSFKADTNEVEVINWVFPSSEILIGTVSGIHTLGTGSDSTAFTPTTVRIKKKSTDGTSSVLPKQIGNYVYYWQKYNRILREYAYSLDVDNYQTNDATAFSEHITESGIVDMDYQQYPLSILWCVRADGKLISFTRQIEQKVAGWAQHDTQGLYKSVAVIPKESYDEVWFVVEREINGTTKKYIEYMVAPEFDEQEDAFFVHSGLTLDNPLNITGATAADPVVITCASHGLSNGDRVKIRGVEGMTELNYKSFLVASASTDTFELTDLDGNDIDGSDYTAYEEGGEVRKCVNSISGLDHLEGETVQVLVDGASHPDCVVSSGAITLDSYYSEVHVGLGYTARLTTNDYEPAPNRVSGQGKIKRISNVIVNLYKSLGCKVGTDEDNLDDIVFRTSAMPTDQAPELYTGIKEIPFPSGWDREKKVVIQQEQPLPLHILSIIIEGEMN